MCLFLSPGWFFLLGACFVVVKMPSQIRTPEHAFYPKIHCWSITGDFWTFGGGGARFCPLADLAFSARMCEAGSVLECGVVIGIGESDPT